MGGGSEKETMKKTWPVLLGLLVLAAPAAVEGQFSYWTNNGVITLSGYNGTGGAVVISNFVTSIGPQAFSECTNLTSITIPGSVTSIGDERSMLLQPLTNATISDGVTNIGDAAFYDCIRPAQRHDSRQRHQHRGGFILDCASLTSVTIPGSVATIGVGAFEDCANLAFVYFEGNAPASGSICV